MSSDSNILHYSGYKVDKLPNNPEIAVYFCRGKLQKWFPNKWIIIDVPNRFKFHDLQNGKSYLIGSNHRESDHKHYFDKYDDSCSSSSDSDDFCEPCGESIVRCYNIPGCEIIIRIPIVGSCPEVSEFSEIKPIGIEDGFFILDVSGIPCQGCAVLTYQSYVCCVPVTINQIIQRPCTIVSPTFCPTLF